MLKYIVAGFLLLVVFIGGVYFIGFAGSQKVAEEKLDIRFGFINEVQNDGGYVLVFDEATWLSGKEGQDAAIAAGLCTEETRAECLPNDFFILNSSTSTSVLRIASQAVIAMQTLHMEAEGVKESQISIEEFAVLMGDTALHWTKVPYQLLLEGGEVTIIEEVYVP